MATLPGLNKGVVKDPTPPATDTVISPITIPDGTILVTTKTLNETIDNVNQIIDYISGDASPNFIPKSAIVDDAEVFTWTADHSMGNSKLIADAGNDIILDAPLGQAVSIEVDGVQEYLFNASNLNMFNNDLDMGTGKINFASSAAMISVVGDNMQFDIPSGIDFYEFSFGGFVKVSLETEFANFGDTGEDYTLRFGMSPNRRIFNSTLGFIFEAESGNSFRYEFVGSTAYLYTETEANFGGNELTNVVIVTPTIASFVNATHNHEDAVGGGQLNALNALDATGTQDSTTFLRGNNTWAVPPVVEVFTWTADHSTGGHRLVSPVGDSIILNAAATRSIILEVATIAQLTVNSTQSDFHNNDLVNTKIITPTIASFTNATHNHQNAAGGGTLLSTSALSDTADIAYLNTPNIFIAGNLNQFSHNTTNAGLRVIPFAGNPTVQNDGELWYNLTTHQIFGRINGVDIDLGVGGGTGLTSINADTTTAQIIAAGIGLDIVDVTNTHTLSIDATVATLTGSQILTNKTIDGDLNTILDINETQMTVSVGVAGTVLTSNGVGVSPTYQAAATGDVFGPASATDNAIARFDGITGKLIQNGIITIDDVANIQAIRSLQFTTFVSPPTGTTHIALVADDFHINTTAGNSIQIMVDDIIEFQLDATTLDLINNNLVMGTAFIQHSSIAEPGVTGSDSVGRVFMDTGNQNHLSIRRNGATVDLEVGEVFKWTANHSTGGFQLTSEAGTPLILEGPNNESIIFGIGGIIQVTIDSNDVTFHGNDILDVGDVKLNPLKRLYLDGGTDSYLVQESAGVLGIIVNGSVIMQWREGVNNEVIIPNTDFKILGANRTALIEMEADHLGPLTNDIIGQIDFYDNNDASSRILYAQIRAEIQVPDDGDESGRLVFAGVSHNSIVDFMSFTGDDATIEFLQDEYTFSSLQADFKGNNLIMGTAFTQYSSIAEPAASGSDSVGRVFMDTGNLNHLSIRRNGASIDLESSGGGGEFFGPMTAAHDYAGFNIEFKTTNPITLGQGATDLLSITFLDDTVNAGVRIGNTDGFFLVENASAVAGDNQLTATFSSGGLNTIQNEIIYQIAAADDSGTTPAVQFTFQDSGAGTLSRPFFSFNSPTVEYLRMASSALWTWNAATVFADLERIEFESVTNTDLAPGSFTVARIMLPQNNAITWDGAAVGTPNSIGFTSSDAFMVVVNNVVKFQVLASQVDFSGSFLSGASGYRMTSSGTNEWSGDTGGLEAKVDSSDSFRVSIGGTDEFIFDSTFLDLQGNIIRDVPEIRSSDTDEILRFSNIGSAAVNFVDIINSITTVGPTISAQGDDTDIDLNFATKGDGAITFNDYTIADTNVQLKHGGNVPSAASMSSFREGNFFDVTGTTTIDFLVDDIFFQGGYFVTFHFDASVTLTHNKAAPPTNFAVMLLKGGIDFTTNAGDLITFGWNGLEWEEVSRTSSVTPGFTMVESEDIVLGTITGTTIGTATSQKLGFWGTTPIIQPIHIADPSGGATVDAEARTAINSILSQLATMGLQASS